MLELSIDLGGLDAGLDRLSRSLEAELHTGLNRTLAFMEGFAKERAPVDTGFLRASIFIVTSSMNGLAFSLASAKAAAPDRVFSYSLPVPKNQLEGFLVAGAEYAIYVEYGAFHRRGNTKRLGSRAGRIGVKLDDGGFATYVPGYLFFADAMDAGRPVMLKEASDAFVRAKRKAGL